MSELFDLKMIDRQTAKKATDYINELSIYKHYEPNIKIGLQKSFFREEKTGSFSLYVRDGKLLWKDFGNGDHGNVFEFVRYWYLKHKTKKSYHSLSSIRLFLWT